MQGYLRGTFGYSKDRRRFEKEIILIADSWIRKSRDSQEILDKMES
jgi:hypothetical protein